MLDASFVRANLALVEANLRLRGQDPEELLKGFAELDAIRRGRITQRETLQAERNRISEEVARRKRAGEDAEQLVERTRSLRSEMDVLERSAAEAEEELRAVLVRLPNMLDPAVPPGKSEDDNVEVSRWGELRQFPFQPKPHWELGVQLGILDLERAAKISGARFAVYWDAGARLERALAAFMLDLHVREHGYREVFPPYLVNAASLFGTGQLPKFSEDLFRCEGSDHWLIPTAEVPVTNLFRDEILDGARLPISLTAYSPCFRSEAGAYGKDVRGIIRQHQFQKVELVKFTRPEDSPAAHEQLTADAEAVLQRLNLPYRKMLLCSTDTGASSAKTYDLEVWLPGQGLFREISSCSNFHDFQARRANLRFRPQGKGRPEFLHTLNGSGLAIGRTWLAILENYQQEDGSVLIPEVLTSYMGGERVIRPNA